MTVVLSPSVVLFHCSSSLQDPELPKGQTSVSHSTIGSLQDPDPSRVASILLYVLHFWSLDILTSHQVGLISYNIKSLTEFYNISEKPQFCINKNDYLYKKILFSRIDVKSETLFPQGPPLVEAPVVFLDIFQASHKNCSTPVKSFSIKRLL